MKKLIIIDNDDEKWRRTISDEDDCDLLDLFIIPRDFSGTNIHVLKNKNIFLQAENEARTYYLKLIRDLPRHNFPQGKIFDILNYNSRNLWWYLAISEKNIWVDKIVHRIYSLLKFTYTYQAGQYEEIIVCLNDIPIRDLIEQYAKQNLIKYRIINAQRWRPLCFFVLKSFRFGVYLLKNIFLCFRGLLKWLALKSLMSVVLSKDNKNYLAFFSVFPQWWGKAFSINPTELFFGDFADRLTGNNEVRHLIWTIMSWRDILARRKTLKEFIKHKKAIILEQRLKFTDYFIYFDWRLFLKLRRVDKLPLRGVFKINGMDLGGIIYEELQKSLFSSELFDWLLLDRALQRTELEKFRAVFFRLEFQPLERALLNNTKKKTLALGFQHSALGKNFLNYVFTPKELEEKTMPLPDYMLLSGRKAYDYLSQAGFVSDKLILAGALRFAALYKYLGVERRSSPADLRKKYGLPIDKKIIFMPISAILSENLCLFTDLAGAIKELGGAYHLIVKINPNKLNDVNFIKQINELLDKNIGVFSYEILTNRQIVYYDYLSLSDAVLLSGGSAGFEALALGIIPIIYLCYTCLSHNPLGEYPEAVLLAHDKESMKKALIDLSEKNIMADASCGADKPLNDVFGDLSVDPHQKMLETLRGIEVVN